MSPEPAVPSLDIERFPRVSGDEPKQLKNLVSLTLFSPRERG